MGTQKLEKRIQSIEDARNQTVSELALAKGEKFQVSNEKVAELASCTIALRNKVESFEGHYTPFKDFQTLSDLASLTAADLTKAWARLERLSQGFPGEQTTTDADELSSLKRNQVPSSDKLPEVHKISSSPGRGFNALMNEARLRRREKEIKLITAKNEPREEGVRDIGREESSLGIGEGSLLQSKRSVSSKRPSSRGRGEQQNSRFSPSQQQEFAASLLNF
jgi:hypothetical protein